MNLKSNYENFGPKVECPESFGFFRIDWGFTMQIFRSKTRKKNEKWQKTEGNREFANYENLFVVRKLFIVCNFSCFVMRSAKKSISQTHGINQEKNPPWSIPARSSQ